MVFTWLAFFFLPSDANSPPSIHNQGFFLSGGSVKETNNIPVKLFEVIASDPDQGVEGNFTFSITVHANTPPYLRGAVSIDNETGVIYLSKVFDFEALPLAKSSTISAQAFYLVYAKDEGNPPLTSQPAVFVFYLCDANDNSPQFGNFSRHVFVNETSAVNSHVLQVSASDLDHGANGRVTFSLTAKGIPDQNNPFTIDASSGVITLVSSLDFTKQSNFELLVTARDNPATSGFEKADPLSTNISLFVDVATARFPEPVFVQINTVEVNETLSVGSDVFRTRTLYFNIATLSSKLRYDITMVTKDLDPIQNATDNSPFAVNAATGAIFLTKSLDFEETQSYEIVVRATDVTDTAIFTDTNVSVLVKNANDNPPFMSPVPVVYSIDLASVDKVIFQILFNATCTDADRGLHGETTFSTIVSTNETMLQVLPSGEIVLDTTESSARNLENLTLEYTCCDRGMPQRCADPATLDVIFSDFSTVMPIVQTNQNVTQNSSSRSTFQTTAQSLTTKSTTSFSSQPPQAGTRLSSTKTDASTSRPAQSTSSPLLQSAFFITAASAIGTGVFFAVIFLVVVVWKRMSKQKYAHKCARWRVRARMNISCARVCVCVSVCLCVYLLACACAWKLVCMHVCACVYWCVWWIWWMSARACMFWWMHTFLLHLFLRLCFSYFQSLPNHRFILFFSLRGRRHLSAFCFKRTMFVWEGKGRSLFVWKVRPCKFFSVFLVRVRHETLCGRAEKTNKTPEINTGSFTP